MIEAIITLLKEDVTLIFPSGYCFTPDKKNNYIDLGYFDSEAKHYHDGLEPLSAKGVERSLNWKKEWEEENE